MSRHYKPLEEAVEQIHNGAHRRRHHLLGLPDARARGLAPKTAGMNELGHQIANYSCFTWLNGSFIVDWLIHNIDVACWVKNDWPVSVPGHGRTPGPPASPTNSSTTTRAEYTFADGTRLFAQGRHMDQCWGFWGDIIQGAKGSGIMGEGQPKPRLFKGHKQTSENVDLEVQRPGLEPLPGPSTTCSSTPSATTSPITRPIAAPGPASPPSWAAWPASPASSSPGTKPSPPRSNWPRASTT